MPNKRINPFPHNNIMPLNELWHTARHKLLREHLQEAVNDFVFHTHKPLYNTSITDLIVWSNKEAQEPTPDDKV